jgi:hypothetical protein
LPLDLVCGLLQLRTPSGDNTSRENAMITVGVVLNDLTKFVDDADLKKFIVDYVADAIVEKVNAVKGVATKAADVAIVDRGVSIGISVTF